MDNRTLEEVRNNEDKLINKIEELKNQQKEFIKYLEDYMDLFDDMDIEEQSSCDTIEEILSKYTEIIGDVEDE